MANRHRTGRHDHQRPRPALPRRLRKNFAVYGPGGFKDSVAVRSGTVADRYLSLDQGMVLGAIGNTLARDLLRTNFVRGEVTQHVRPLLELEEFAIPADQLATRGTP